MSLTFYAYRETAEGTEFSDGPNFSNANARMILRSLGYGEEILDDYGEPGPLNAHELKGRCLTALAVGAGIADDGMPATERQHRRVRPVPGLLPLGLRAPRRSEAERVAVWVAEAQLGIPHGWS